MGDNDRFQEYLYGGEFEVYTERNSVTCVLTST